MSVVFYRLFCKMLRTIQLDYQFCCVALEVCNITADCFFLFESNRIASQKIIPKMVFLSRRIFAQFSCAWNQFMLVWQRHLAFPILSIVDSLRQLSLTPPSAREAWSPSKRGMSPLATGGVTQNISASMPFSAFPAFQGFH